MLLGPIARIVSLVLSTLYPAYASFKAIRTKNVREYVKWMMYWVVFGVFTGLECIADIFVGIWLPFYSELKLFLIFWLISPISNESLGSTVIYKKIVHPYLIAYEEEIDHTLSRFQNQGLSTLSFVVRKVFQFFTNFMLENVNRNGPRLFRDEPDGNAVESLENQFHEGGGIRLFFGQPQIPVDRGVTFEQFQSCGSRNFADVTDEVDFSGSDNQQRSTRGRGATNNQTAEQSSESDAPFHPSSDMEVDSEPEARQRPLRRRGRKPKQVKTEEAKEEPIKKRTTRKKASNL